MSGLPIGNWFEQDGRPTHQFHHWADDAQRTASILRGTVDSISIDDDTGEISFDEFEDEVDNLLAQLIVNSSKLVNIEADMAQIEQDTAAREIRPRAARIQQEAGGAGNVVLDHNLNTDKVVFNKIFITQTSWAFTSMRYSWRSSINPLDTTVLDYATSGSTDTWHVAIGID